MKIGIVLAGCASKGPYEVGVLKALEEYFGLENIRYISSASVGALFAQAHCTGVLDELCDMWRNIDTEKNGKFILSYTGNENILSDLDSLFDNDNKSYCEHTVCLWNFNDRKVEYVPFHTLSKDDFKQYMRAAISVPFFTKGTKINGTKFYDGAFLDNIPVSPLVDKDLDFIFCVYFDNRNYIFENEEFDKKVIKLFDFPNTKRLEVMFYSRESLDAMAQYGYEYTTRIVKQLFDGAENTEQVHTAIVELEKTYTCKYKPRLTADTVLSNLNFLSKHYTKQQSTRTKKK